MKKEEILNNMTYFSRCLKLLKFDKPVTKRQIREITKDTINSPTLNNLLKFLELNFFIDIDRTRIPYEYYFNRKKFANFLRESVFFEEFGKIIEITNSIYVY